MDLAHICYDDMYRSKVLFRNTSNRAYELKVKVLDLKFGFKVLTAHIFLVTQGTSTRLRSSFYLNYLDRFISYIVSVWLVFIIIVPCAIEIPVIIANSVDLIRRRVLRRLIWVHIVCHCPFYRTPGIMGYHNFIQYKG